MTRTPTSIDETDLDLGDDLSISAVTPRELAGGTWVCGTVHGHRFEALVFVGHADVPEHEVPGSRISKLWLQRLSDRRQAYNWDRGLDQAPADATAAAIVSFLAAGLAEHVYGM